MGKCFHFSLHGSDRLTSDPTQLTLAQSQFWKRRADVHKQPTSINRLLLKNRQTWERSRKQLKCPLGRG